MAKKPADTPTASVALPPGVEVTVSAGATPAAVPTPAPGEMVAVPTKIRVARTVKVKRAPGIPADEAMASEPEETIEVHHFATTPAMATVSIDAKKCVNFNSVGISIGISRPCYFEELPDALTEAYERLKERLLIELPQVVIGAHKLGEMTLEKAEEIVKARKPVA